VDNENIQAKSHEILSILNKMKITTSSGSDGLSPAVFRYCATELSGVVTEIINRTLLSGKLPDAWKISRITPIQKPNSTQAGIKFRPIACTSTFLKIAEHFILKNIKPIITRNSDSNQFAYKRGRSTLDAVAYLHHIISSSLDAGSRIFKCVFLDFSSAFNTFDRQSIIDKLAFLNTPNSIIRWIADYFTNCLQYVSANGQHSDTISNNRGVLQGAVLSPVLFSLHTDSLTSVNSNNVVKYADDTVVAGKSSDAADIENFQQSLNNIQKWSTENGLLLNKLKSLECVFSLQNSSATINPAHQLMENQFPA
jgi:hypothetical protein